MDSPDHRQEGLRTGGAGAESSAIPRRIRTATEMVDRPAIRLRVDPVARQIISRSPVK
jgi:hypothetical protein